MTALTNMPVNKVQKSTHLRVTIRVEPATDRRKEVPATVFQGHRASRICEARLQIRLLPSSPPGKHQALLSSISTLRTILVASLAQTKDHKRCQHLIG